MAISQEKSRRKVSGGLYRDYRKKRLFNLGNNPTLTKLNKHSIKIKREKSGSYKFTLLSTNKVNVLDPKTKKYQMTEITTVVDNTANRQFVRRNIMTKGAFINTKIGKAKITSRPGQEGTLNAILVSE